MNIVFRRKIYQLDLWLSKWSELNTIYVFKPHVVYRSNWRKIAIYLFKSYLVKFDRFCLYPLYAARLSQFGFYLYFWAFFIIIIAYIMWLFIYWFYENLIKIDILSIFFKKYATCWTCLVASKARTFNMYWAINMLQWMENQQCYLK